MKSTANQRKDTTNLVESRHTSENGRITRCASKGSGALMVGTGLLLLFFDGVHPFLQLVWSACALWLFRNLKLEETRYMDELAREVSVGSDALGHLEAAAQHIGPECENYEAPLWDGGYAGYFIVWV